MPVGLFGLPVMSQKDTVLDPNLRMRAKAGRRTLSSITVHYTVHVHVQQRQLVLENGMHHATISKSYGYVGTRTHLVQALYSEQTAYMGLLNLFVACWIAAQLVLETHEYIVPRYGSVRLGRLRTRLRLNFIAWFCPTRTNAVSIDSH